MELCQFLFLKATGRRCSADFKPAQEPSQLEHKVEDHNLCGNEHITLQVLPGMENCRQGRWCRIQTSRSVPGVDELRVLAPSSRWRNGNLVCAVNVRMELPPADQRMHDSRVAIGTGCVRGTCVRDKRITQLHRSLFLQHVGHSIPWPKNAACAGLKHLPHEPSAFSMCCWVWQMVGRAGSPRSQSTRIPRDLRVPGARHTCPQRQVQLEKQVETSRGQETQGTERRRKQSQRLRPLTVRDSTYKYKPNSHDIAPRPLARHSRSSD